MGMRWEDKRFWVIVVGEVGMWEFGLVLGVGGVVILSSLRVVLRIWVKVLVVLVGIIGKDLVYCIVKGSR